MHVVVVEFVIEPERAEAFRARILQQAKDSVEREERCRSFDVCVDPERENRFILYEVYDTPEDFEAHLETPHFKAFNAEVGPWILEKRFDRVTRLASLGSA